MAILHSAKTGAIAALGSVLLITLCGGGDMLAADAGSPPPPRDAADNQVAPVGVEYLRAVEYKRLGQMLRDADIVAVVEASSTPSVDASIDRAIFTNYKVDVRRVLRGASTAQQLTIRQIGRPSAPAEDVQYFASGERYLVFLKELHFKPGDNTGIYDIAGTAAGFYKAASGGSYEKIDSRSPGLPSVVREADVPSA